MSLYIYVFLCCIVTIQQAYAFTADAVRKRESGMQKSICEANYA